MLGQGLVAALQAGREEARKDAGAAREEAAEIRGRVEALQVQVTELTRTLAEPQGPLSLPAGKGGNIPVRGFAECPK